ncbi:MAG: prepilin-type N-terminal cleavage/methylation domain-containing protein [Planctomycetota bacterium]
MAQRAFSLIELVVVVVILAVIATIALPRFSSTMQNAAYGSFASSMIQFQQAMELYRIENGDWPPDGTTGTPHEYFEPYAPIGLFESDGASPIGGLWDHEHESSGIVGFGVHWQNEPLTPDGLSVISRFDLQNDDGNTSTGSARQIDSTRYYRVLEEP